MTPFLSNLEISMNPLKRKSVSKRGSARQFHNAHHHTKAVNLAPAPMRGGYRL